MKKAKIILALLLFIFSLVVIIYTVTTQENIDGLMLRMDPQNLADSDSKMLKARDRVLDSLKEGDRTKALRNLDRYTGDFAGKLELGGQNGLDLFGFKNGPSLIASGLLILVIAAALLISAYDKSGKYKRAALSVTLIAALYAGVYIVENIAGSSSMLMTVLKKGAIYALIAVSMNLLNGFTGLFSLGQAGFMLVGAYTYAIFTITTESRAQVYQYYDGGLVQFVLPALIAIVLAGLAAAFFAFLIGLPVLRLKSDYLAIATLGFAEIIRAVFQYDGLGPITNGSNLLRMFTTFDTALFPFAVAGVSILLITMLIHSTYGRSFKAIRDDEIAAEAMGINLFRHKQMSFVISSFFAGVGGALLAMYQTTVQASAFKASMTYEILLIVVIGGMGSITGSILASFLFVASGEWWLRFLDSEQMIGSFQVPLLRSGFRMVVFSVVIMVMVLFYRRGIMGDKEFSLKSLLEPRVGKGGKKRG
jgi:branched-chain amino acid transport system permease protein